MVRLTGLLKYRTKNSGCCLTFLANRTLKNPYIAHWVLTHCAASLSLQAFDQWAWLDKLGGHMNKIMRPQHTCKHIKPAVKQFASCWNPDSETQRGTLEHQRQSFTRLLIMSRKIIASSTRSGNYYLTIANSCYNIYQQNNLPNWYISPADIITPILPRVSANTWRNTPERREKIKKERKEKHAGIYSKCYKSGLSVIHLSLRIY